MCPFPSKYYIIKLQFTNSGKIMNKIKLAFLGIFTILILLLVALLSYIFIEPKAYDFMIKHVAVERLPFDNTKDVYGHNDIVLVIIEEIYTIKL